MSRFLQKVSIIYVYFFSGIPKNRTQLDDKRNILDDATLEALCIKLFDRNGEYLAKHCADACKGKPYCAEDLMQDIFCAVWRSRHTIRAGSSNRQLDKWLRAKVRTVTYDFLRIRHLKWVHSDSPGADVVVGAESVEALDNPVDILLSPLSQEETRLMHLWVDGYTQNEIASIEKVSYISMRKRFSRMFNKIKKYVNENNIIIDR